jgi:hypothetical protein
MHTNDVSASTMTQPPDSGIYDCVIKEHEIDDKKTTDTMCGGAVTEST